MENFRLERVEKICDDLQGLITVQNIDVPTFQMKHGFFLTPKEADESNIAWQTFDCKKDVWQGPDDHYWFRATITVQEGFNKKPLWLSFVTQATFWDAVNPQFLLFINGEVTQGVDVNHREIKIFDKAKAGDEIVIDLQAYTGRDNDLNKGTTDNLRLMANVIELDERINELYYNLSVPNRIASQLNKKSQSRINLQLALEKAINMLDLRCPYSKEFYNSVDECNAFVQKRIYEELANNDDVIATCIGHTHIDVAWWWTVEQTREKTIRSFSTVLKLMDEYKDYKFMSSQPQLYQFVKERYPEVYEKIKERVKEGRWETEGGMWVESDCNVTSGESLIRQFMHGKKFFKDEFNKDNKILWLPDVFGYSAALPQIMKKCGIDYFMTTKIAWNEFNELPVDTFMWRGIDGTETFTHLITTQDEHQPKDSFYTTYNGKLDPVCLMRGWDRYHEKELNNDILVCYGYGDGGGGPSRPMLETGIRMEKGVTGSPKVRMEPSLKYFEELYERCGDSKDLPKWVGELYLETHRGTYTSMARNKRSNRKCEILWADVELFSVMAQSLGENYETDEIYKAWETILLNQFHDIIPGSSIFEVYEVTKKEYAHLETRAKEIISQKLTKIANATSAKVDELVVFNSLSFDRDDSVIVDNSAFNDVTSFIDDSNNILPVAKTSDGKITFNPVCIPAKGYSVFTPNKNSVSSNPRITINENSIETPFYKIGFDKAYQFTSIFDKDFSREVIKNGEKANVLRVYEDKPTYYDNWNIDIYYTQKSWICDDVTSAEWVENNDVRAVLQITRKFLDSTIIQKIIFYTNSRRIDFDTYVDWKQFNLLMKCEFPVDINANEATYDIQFGNLKRPTHKNTSWDAAKFEVCGHKWADLSEGNYGVALLNDCKYGYAINDSTMTLSLIKSGCVPNPVADQEEHFFTYAILPHDSNDFEDIAKEAYCLNIPSYSAKCESSEQKISYESFVTLDAQNVIMEVTKKADDNDGIIIRLYEFQNRRTNVNVTLADKFNKVYECNMLEENEASIADNSTTFSFEIKPFEVKTFRIK